MDRNLEGKVAIVTGGSRGIGRSIAQTMSQAGAKVMITSRKADACEETAEAITQETGGEVAYVPGHVGRSEDTERVVTATLDTFGAIDILVNNAATNPYAGPVIDVDIPRWEKTFDVNVTAPLAWVQACWGAYMKEHGGNIINISYVGAFSTNAILGVYDITKSALIHLTQQLAAELGPNTRVNAICPGTIKGNRMINVIKDKANFLKASKKKIEKEFVSMASMNCWIYEEDIGKMCSFLISEESERISGQVIGVDGNALRLD